VNARTGTLLSTDLADPEAIPYFLWDEPMTVAEFRRRLTTGSVAQRTRLLAKLMREARDTDVWKFTSPAEVWERWSELAPRLGRRRAFWEFLLNRWNEEGLVGNAIVIDLARDFVVQMVPDKPMISGIRVDAPQEILANKLCTLLSRSEIRDLVDVRALEAAGYRIEDVWAAAQAKDRGLTPAQLAWVLSQIEMGDDVALPAGASPADLRQYLADLIKRLTSAAFPSRN